MIKQFVGGTSKWMICKFYGWNGGGTPKEINKL